MTRTEAIEYLTETEESAMTQDELAAVYEALYGVSPDAQDIADGLLSLCMAHPDMTIRGEP